MPAELRVLSLGWGVQSWTLAAMAAVGELEPVDYAIHADTGWEQSGTYTHAARWTPWLVERGVNVVTVKAQRNDVVRADWGSGAIMIPAYSLDRASGDRGQIKRQCTHDWKIMPIRAFIRQELQSRGLTKTPGRVESIQGISLDEFHRMRDSDVKYIVNRYPLVDRRMTRANCVTWLHAHDLPVPAKSACIFCPFTNNRGWRHLKQAGGYDWETAKEVDANIRDRRSKCTLYIHPARKPLAEAVRIPEDEGAHQIELAGCDGGVCFV